MTRTRFTTRSFVIVADHEPGWELYTLLSKVPNATSAAWLSKDTAEIRYANGTREIVGVKSRKLPSRR